MERGFKMAETLTHWKKLTNPDYLGAYALEPGKDLVVTIKSVGREMVTGSDGKKEELIVARFVEPGVKPMILNATNCKTISKLAKTSYIEKWSGLKIQIFIDKVRAFGDVVEALRIRPYAPKQTAPAEKKCAKCGKVIGPYANMNAEQIAAYTKQAFGVEMCGDCGAATKAAQAEKSE